MRVSIIVPTLNPGPLWSNFSSALVQNVADLGLTPASVLIIDSESTDGTAAKAAAAGFRVLPILREDFDHGRTRQLGVEHETRSSILIFLTQDSVLATSDSLRTLLTAFADRDVCAAYGRQLPRPGASGIETHARLFSYPATSRRRSLKDRHELGYKSIFASNAFCAFRRDALLSVGGFPNHVICSEETIAIARMHLEGWQSAYVAEAAVFHSHPYTMLQEFRRYFDVGVTHARQPFLLEEFGAPTGEGKRFVKSEVRFLLKNDPGSLPSAMVRTVTKFLGYRFGRSEAAMTLRARKWLSMNPAFWNQDGYEFGSAKVEPRSHGKDAVWSPTADRAYSERSPDMVPQQMHTSAKLPSSGKLPAEVPPVAPVQQQRLR